MIKSIYFPDVTLEEKYCKFKVNPLDLHITEIQFKLSKMLKNADKIPSEQSMIYQSKDPTMKLDCFKFGYESAGKEGVWRCYMETTSTDGHRFYVESKLLSTDELLFYLDYNEFLFNAKSFVYATCS